MNGYRALAIKTGGAIRLVSRNDKDFGGRYPAIVKALRELPDEMVIDGEVVALDEWDDLPSMRFKNHRSSTGSLIYYAFDVFIRGARSA